MHFLFRGRGRGSGALPARGAWLCRFAVVALLASGSLGSVVLAQSAPADADADAIATPKDEPGRHVRVHYMWSNERRHDLFFADLNGLHGGYLGVGGDQNYTLAAAAQSQVLWLIDLDAAVVNMHRLYAALLEGSPTIKDFLGQFATRNKDAVHAAVAARYPDPIEQRAVLEVYHAYRDLLGEHLRQTAQHRRGSTWLSDAAKYQHIRELAMKKRIVARVGDLLGPHTMLEIAAAAKRAATPVRVIYLSNAESWFRYGPDFRRNLSALPIDEKSVVLRTVKSQLLSYPSSDIWHYSLQRSQHFVAGLERPAYRSVDIAMLDAVALPHRREGLSYIGFPDEHGQKPLLARGPQAKSTGRDARRALLAAGLVTRPAGNRERASEMDRERLRRAALELSGSSTVR